MQAQSNTANDIKINDISELDTIEELVARYPDKFTKSQLQWQLRFRDQNGLDAAVVKFGRRLYGSVYMPQVEGHVNAIRFP